MMHNLSEENSRRTISTALLNKLVIVAAWIVIWEVAALVIHNELLFVSPIRAAEALLQNAGNAYFWLSVGNSVLRIAIGFAAGLLLGIILSVGAVKSRVFKEFCKPVIQLMKTVPIAVFIVCFLIWWGKNILTVAVCVLVVTPNVYISILEGIKNVRTEESEVAYIFDFTGKMRYEYIIKPAINTGMKGAVKLCVGMCFKAGVAAEIIGIPKYSIGEGLYMSKIYLDTAGVFAWALITVIVSALMEKLALYFTQLYFDKTPTAFEIPKAFPESRQGKLVLNSVTKAYGDREVLSHITKEYDNDRIYYIEGESGSGKTTLLRIVAGLCKPDAGEVMYNGIPLVKGNISFCFQENRLFDSLSAFQNVFMVCGDKEEASRILSELIGCEDMWKKVSELSGGTRRRVCLARALSFNTPVILLDEPFAGLDEENVAKAKEIIEKEKKGRIIIVATHIK